SRIPLWRNAREGPAQRAVDLYETAGLKFQRRNAQSSETSFSKIIQRRNAPNTRRNTQLPERNCCFMILMAQRATLLGATRN
ncbi:hypothetical protein A2U01_0065204, partial [Trifolium medium]|nr:hypothetical protein [Trifolium medium]